MTKKIELTMAILAGLVLVAGVALVTFTPQTALGASMIGAFIGWLFPGPLRADTLAHKIKG